MYIIYVVDDNGVYFSIVVINFPFYVAFTPALYRPSTSFYGPILYGYEWYF